MESHILRALHYLPGGMVPSVIAHPHLDKGTGTLHLYESTPGFQYLASDGSWRDVEFASGETLIIAGFRMQHRSGCRVEALDHQVVASNESVENGRDSIVLFLDAEGGEYYDKERWKSMQRWPAGYFRGMPFEMLKQYFRPG